MGPEGAALSGVDIHPSAPDVMGDGIDQDCDGGLEYDFDGDGFDRVADGGEDCDDDDAQISPAATEVCDGLDDDCDGLVDDEDPDVMVGDWYLDGDQDGYGQQEAVASACEAPTGYSTVGGDCQDGNSGVHPGVDEVCDEVDQDCDGTVDEDPLDGSTWYADEDDDGYGDPNLTLNACDVPTGYVADSSDCDDTDNSLHPGADEICDEIDQDCNGAVDEDGVDAPIWYYDGDGDGYGTAAFPEAGCQQPDYCVADDTDCNDLSAEINPGASELCNGYDDDCDGLEDDLDDSIDPSELSIWYADVDEDGYGDESASVEDCFGPSGYTLEGGDCDDDDDDSYPGAPEVCATGVVEDCDASVDDAREACTIGDLAVEDADAARWGDYDDCELGLTVARSGVGTSGAGLMLGGPRYSSGRGLLYLIEGPLTRGGSSLSDSSSFAARRNGGSGSGLGTSLVGDVDVDGDGYADLLGGAPGAAFGSHLHSGAVWLELGPLTGTASISASSDSALSVASSSAYLGSAVAAASLLGSTGYADIVAGAPSSSSVAGAVYLLAGPPDPGTTELLASASYALEGDSADDQAGAALAAVDDVDGDGNADLLVGIPGSSDRAFEAGIVTLLLGPIDSSGTLADLAALTFRGTAASSAVGSAVASAGDVNDDGYDDLLVGGPGTSAGGAWLVLGADAASLPLSVLAASADAALSGAAGDEAGSSVSGDFDIDGDGNSEILIGGPGASDGAGIAWLLYGPVSGTISLSIAADITLSGEAVGDALGSGVSGLGDTDGDGLDDLVVGAPGVDVSSLTDAGEIYLFARWY